MTRSEAESEDRPRPSKQCGCSGVRWCAACRAPELRAAFKMDDPLLLPERLRTPPSDIARDFPVFETTSQSAPGAPEFSGLCIIHKFLSKDEERSLLDDIERTPFALAQSGKWKQHYGAKINFNKRKINASAFTGHPPYVPALESRMKQAIRAKMSKTPTFSETCRQALDAFQTTDTFVLRYEAAACSNLDFHIDDTFAYGEGILALSLESDTVLTFIHRAPEEEDFTQCVRVPLPARSLAFLYGSARFEWEHAILPYDIQARRTSLTFRCLSPEALRTKEGQLILSLSKMPTSPLALAMTNT